MRHTFAYMTGCYRIPLPVVQSILGHMSPEMTKHYQAHADREAKEKYLAQLPDFIGQREIKSLEPAPDSLRITLIHQLQQLPEEKLPAVADFLKTL